jgi:hypothetical protein
MIRCKNRQERIRAKAEIENKEAVEGYRDKKEPGSLYNVLDVFKKTKN